MQNVPNTVAGPPKIFRLKAITSRIMALFSDKMSKRFWVQAQLVVQKGGRDSGNFFCELLDVDEKGKPTAKIRACIWKTQLASIRRRLRESGFPDALENNKEVCVQCSVNYHEVYGLSLYIHDVDPTFGEAQIDRNRRLILENLQSEGLFAKNKEKTLSAASLRIGLITADGSAAFNDFKKTLSESGFAFKIILASASMQGENMEPQVLAAIRNLVSVGVEVICIIRGGGSAIDLAWFDNEKVARAIAASPVPIWIGIGHEIDQGVLDFVAHTQFKTPTALAEVLVKRLNLLDDRLAIAKDRLRDLTQGQMSLTTQKLEQNCRVLKKDVRKQFNESHSSLLNHLRRVRSGFETEYIRRQGRLEESITRLRERLQARQNERSSRLGNAETKLKEKSSVILEIKKLDLERDLTGLRNGSRKHLELRESQIQLQVSSLRSAVERITNNRKNRLVERAFHVQSRILEILKEYSKALKEFNVRIEDSTERTWKRGMDLLLQQQGRFRRARYEKLVQVAVEGLLNKQKRVENLRPEKLLERGFTITRIANGNLIRSIKEVKVGQEIFTEVIDGLIRSTVNVKGNQIEP
jgi:exodeoxyribonuclease VII large subunit